MSGKVPPRTGDGLIVSIAPYVEGVDKHGHETRSVSARHAGVLAHPAGTVAAALRVSRRAADPRQARRPDRAGNGRQ